MKGIKAEASVAKLEVIQVLATTGILVLVQVILSMLGFGGMLFAAALYVGATFATNIFFVDTAGVHSRDEEENLPSSTYLFRSLTNLGLVFLGMVLWFIIGVIHGVDRIVTTAKSPDELLKQMTGDRFFLKVVYAAVSHLTLFSFCRFFTNLVLMIQAMWRGTFGIGGGKKGK